MSDKNRQTAADFIDRAYKTANPKVVTLSRSLLERSVELFWERLDKEWGLTDCISFVVMQDQGLVDAFTSKRSEVMSLHWKKMRYQCPKGILKR